MFSISGHAPVLYTSRLLYGGKRSYLRMQFLRELALFLSPLLSHNPTELSFVAVQGNIRSSFRYRQSNSLETSIGKSV